VAAEQDAACVQFAAGENSRRLAAAVTGPVHARTHDWQAAKARQLAAKVGFGRIFVSEIEVPKMTVNIL
jgi:hypothetical protein